MTTADEVELGDLKRRDLKAVMAIEAQVFPEPWSLTVFQSELALRQGRRYRAARRGKELAGYMGLMFVDDEAHVTTIGVAPDYQRQGIGVMLMLDGLRYAIEHGTAHISLEVAAGNERAQSLYRQFGFAPIAVRKQYYQKTGEDAFVMWAYDINTPTYAARLDLIENRVKSS